MDIIINKVDRVDHLHSLIRQDLRDLGVKLPKSKKLRKLNHSRRSISVPGSQQDVFSGKIFGEPICHVPCTFLTDYGYVPQFLVAATDIIDQHLVCEGIFRKSGSLNRQKELRLAIDEKKPLDGANVFDLAALIKQFFRELPEPLFITAYHDSFIKCYQLPPDKDPKKALLQMCLLLPIENIGTLRFTMHMLSRVASKCENNKMTANNLALVLAPNLMHNNKGGQKMSSTEERLLHIQTCIVELLIKNWELIGMVSPSLQQQVTLMSECFATDDDLDASDDNTLEESKDVTHKKIRKRSGSLTGLVSTIAQGFAKLRRSTDGKNINMSANSSCRGEMSIASNSSASQSEEMSLNPVTPCVMRKRRASGDNVPFSASKKQAILGNLPQRSALASTPFTPASTIKRGSHRAHDTNVPSTPLLNATTPAMGTKPARKKLSLFTSPTSNKKIKRQSSAAASVESPTMRNKSSKSKSIFKRLSGSRSEKLHEETQAAEHIGERLAFSVHASPRSTVSDSVLYDQSGNLLRSMSSPTIQDTEDFSVNVVDDSFSFDKDLNDGLETPHDETNSVQEQVFSKSVNAPSKHTLPGRSKSVDSPGLRRGHPNTVNNGLLKLEMGSTPKHKGKLNKSLISDPCPVIVPIVPNPVDIRPDSEMRRSRRDEFEREKMRLLKNMRQGLMPPGDVLMHNDRAHESKMCQLESSLLEVVLPPPPGFGDQTMLEVDVENQEEDEEIDVGSDLESEAGFSTISGGTVMRRTESGNYSRHSTQTMSTSTLASSASCELGVKAPKPTLQSSVSVDSLLSIESMVSQDSSVSHLGLSLSYDSGKGSLAGEMADDLGISTNSSRHSGASVRARPGNNKHSDDQVILRHLRCEPIQVSGSQLCSKLEESRGLKMLCENYTSMSEEDDSSETKGVCNISVSSHQQDLDNMPRKTDVSRKKSVSSEDLKSAQNRLKVPVRAHSMYVSPCKKINFKPHLEITRQTHNMLARAGYFKPSEDKSNDKDIIVPVKSPKRSLYREEMMNSLRSSFHERHGRINASFRSLRNCPNTTGLDSSEEKRSLDTLSSQNSAVQNACSQDILVSANDQMAVEESETTVDETELMQNICEVSANIVRAFEGSPVSPQQDVMEVDDGRDLEKSIEVDQIMETSSQAPSKIERDDIPAQKPGVVNCTLKDEIPAQKACVVNSKLKDEIPAQKACVVNSKLKDIKEALTLSGMLDKAIASQVKIKRAELILPKHDSILNIKQAGLVANSIKHFSQNQHHGIKNNSTARTILRQGVSFSNDTANNQDASTHLRDLDNLSRERTGNKCTDLPLEIKSRSMEQDEADMSEGDSASEGNVTVLEMTSEQTSVSTTPVKRPHIELSDSLMETINDICTPRAEKFFSVDRDEDLVKSPLKESTNNIQSALVASLRAGSLSENIKLRTSSKTPHRLVLPNEMKPLQTPVSAKSQRPQIKRLRTFHSPRKVNHRSPKLKSPHHLRSPGKFSGPS